MQRPTFHRPQKCGEKGVQPGALKRRMDPQNIQGCNFVCMVKGGHCWIIASERENAYHDVLQSKRRPHIATTWKDRKLEKPRYARDRQTYVGVGLQLGTSNRLGKPFRNFRMFSVYFLPTKDLFPTIFHEIDQHKMHAALTAIPQGTMMDRNVRRKDNVSLVLMHCRSQSWCQFVCAHTDCILPLQFYPRHGWFFFT